MTPILASARAIAVFGALVLVVAVASATAFGLGQFVSHAFGLGLGPALGLVVVAEGASIGATALYALGGAR